MHHQFQKVCTTIKTGTHCGVVLQPTVVNQLEQTEDSMNFLLPIDQVWKSTLHDPSTTSYCANHGIHWNFITELSPWMGGFYERLVGIVKRNLRKSIGRLCLTRIQLETLVIEVEAVVNSRPLVYVGEDISSDKALTPADFLSLNTLHGTPSLTVAEEQTLQNLSTKDHLLAMWKKGQTHLERFWTLFRDDYLLSLRERYQSVLKAQHKTSCDAPMVGDVVLIQDHLPRGSWKTGRIQSLYTSKDGCVRSATVRLPNGQTLNRSVTHLFPIEVSSRSLDTTPPITSTANTNNCIT